MCIRDRAVTRVLLTNVVVRAAPFQRTEAPFTKPVPLTVSVNAVPPAVALVGESDVSVTTDCAGQLTCATASPPFSKYSTCTTCAPAVRVAVAVYVVVPWSNHALMIRSASTHTRIPSSEVAVNVVLPEAKLKVPVQRTENASVPTPLPGPPVPQLLLMVDSHLVNVGLPLRLV